MDSSIAAKIVHDRIKKLEPNVATKILGYIYLQEIPRQELIRLALGPDASILNFIQPVKTAVFPPSSPLVSPQTHFPRFSPRYFSNVKSCHYFNKGACKHGSNCRYFHSESFQVTFGPNKYEDHRALYPLSLEKLELEIVELLKLRKGHPISIASLPMMYFEKYRRTLRAEGYLTETQRHGKAAYNLTKLLAQLTNIRLIDRPHGQHAVMLAEDVPMYMEIRGDTYINCNQSVNGSMQIYLTFPAESIFTEEDVSNYFRTFGPVQDVRIPFQQKRMFGFVTFVSAYTVRLILSQGNPHYVCGARVLVKPYREKSKLAERKYLKKLESPTMHSHSHALDIASDFKFRVSHYDEALELETRYLSQLQLAPYEVKSPVNKCGDQESAQGLNLPDSPYRSSVSAVN